MFEGISFLNFKNCLGFNIDLDYYGTLDGKYLPIIDNILLFFLVCRLGCVIG